MSTSINNTVNTSISIEIPGTGAVSLEAYMEFNKLREAYENYEDVFNIWTNNPFFHVALYNYYKVKGMKANASDFKKAMLNHSYYISYKGINVYNLSKGEHFTVNIEKTSKNGNIEITEYINEKAWEVLKDLSQQVVMNF